MILYNTTGIFLCFADRASQYIYKINNGDVSPDCWVN